MKEYKFRAIDTQGIMRYGNFVNSSNVKSDWYFIESFTNGNRQRYQVIPESVGQFTDLKDKEGTEIYADDIMTNGVQTFRIYKVTGGFAIKTNYWADNLDDLTSSDVFIMQSLADLQVASWIKTHCTVIGNIHQKEVEK